MSERFEDFDLIHTYSRAEALADGTLVDVSDTAREVGIRFPVAVTSRVWHELVEPPAGLEGEGQSVRGRLWDLVWMMRQAAVRAGGTDQIAFRVLFRQADQRLHEVELKALCGPGDDAAPVITILFPTED